jgi:leucyl aminopeptidase
MAAVTEARDLINTPVLDLTAEDLAARAEELGQIYGFKVTVLNQAKIESLKMGGLLGVNKGSVDPATFSILEYKPEKAVNSAPYVLVGKGVVYDTGGLSLKPSNFMDTMKCDMSGAAAVIGTLCAVAGQGLPVHVIGLIPATDNRPGGNAITPGDVITISDGTTVEVLNTDAEGRLILADALHYAKKYKPQLVIDLATLTGAAARAIGPNATVAMGNASREVWEQLQTSAANTHERLVEFPFWDEYNDLLKSEIADLKNIGGAEAGAITAGKFLEHFTDYPYVHLDIAGPAFLDSPWGYYGKGGTGVGVRLLTDFLTHVAS